MYGSVPLEYITTSCHYLGLMQGSVNINGHKEVRPFVYFTPRNIVTFNCWQSPVGGWRDNFYIECSGERADRFFAAFGAATAVKYYFVRDLEPFIVKFRTWQRLFKQGNVLNSRRITLCLEETAALLQEDTEFCRQSHPANQLIQKFMQQVSANPGQPFDLAAEAAACQVTLRHWNRLFIAWAGVTPYRFIIDCRRQLARELLSSSDLSIKAIADRCGFVNASDFTRFFRRYEALTPGHFRRLQVLR